jgi:glucosamine--fructose-6-phosphate aminotransferase (isomerizing)
MRREIGEIPATVERILGSAGEIEEVAAALARFGARWVTIAARGTSDHAAVYAQYLIETQLGIPTGLAKPSVTTLYDARLEWRGGLLLAISQSGRSPDIVAVTTEARRGGALTIAITNDDDTPLAAASDHVLRCQAGRELAVPATKTYVAELAVVAALVQAIRPSAALGDGLRALPGALRDAISVSGQWLAGPGAEAVEALASVDRALLVSRGYNLATAFEIALKLKETVGVFAEAYSTADFAHGPLVLAQKGVPTLAIRPDGPMGADVDATLAAVEARGGRTTVIGGPESAGRRGALSLPHVVDEALTPLLYVVPGQMLVEAAAVRRGVSPDAPDGLGKVTRTR